MALLVYFDDILITTNRKEEASDLKIFLDSKFCLNDLGKLFLGLEVYQKKERRIKINN